MGKAPKEVSKTASSLSSDLLCKMGAAYNGYRQAVMSLLPHIQETLDRSGLEDNGLKKLAQAPLNELFTPLSAAYLKTAFWDETAPMNQARADVERGLPSRNT